MRILLNDYGGYPFPIELSRTLAGRGHTVCHAWCASLPTTPQGALARRENDPPGLRFEGVRLARQLDKFSFARRWQQENEYGRRIARVVQAFRPDAVISANTPLDAQRTLYRSTRAAGARFIFWVQDLLGLATDRILRRKIPVAGAAVGAYYLALERNLLRKSDRVILITDDFQPLMEQWGIPRNRTSVVENWAPLGDVPVRPKDNDWSRRHGLHDKLVVLYSGTMGMKHNPALLLQLATSLGERPEARVVVVSQGLGADWLRDRQAEAPALVLLPYQPFHEVPDMMGAADVLTAVLEPDASAFSVPSKVLAYLCAARSLLLGVPQENLAARIVQRVGAGEVVAPDDPVAFVSAAHRLLRDSDGRRRQGEAARRYAEDAFDVERITNRFEVLLTT